MKCKLFFSSGPESVGKALRQWLDEQNGRVSILSVAADANYYGYSIAVFYEQVAGPFYQLSTLSARKHDSLEEQVNQVLASASPKGAPMVAMGSNQLGHCLFILWAEGSEKA